MKKFVEKHLPGLAIRYRSWRDRRIFEAQVMRPTSLGFDFIGVPGMPESRTESGEVAALRELLRGKDLFVDVGANCGLYSLVACHAGVPVLAIEPNELNFSRLQQNLAHNGYDAGQALNLAVGAEKGRSLLYGGGEGASLLKNWGGMASTYAREVDVESLDDLMRSRASAGQVLIKLDVEGHELAVLAGARGLLAGRASASWIVEHSFRENHQGRVNPRFMELFELFWGAGYGCATFDLARRPVLREDVVRWLDTGVRDFGHVNYVFQKPECH